MNRRIWNFVWSGSVDMRKMTTVSCSKCCLRVKKCGLGIKHIGLFNKALLGKLAWKLISKALFVFYFLPSRYFAYVE